MEGVVDGMELLQWLQTGIGDERDLQMMALEQLCMTLLMSDNIDRCFESCPPRTFLPALGRILVDETAPENILEVTARAITYYLDVSNECTRRITQVDGAIKAICHRLIVAKMNDRTSKDLAEQCVKLLEHICQREASAVFDAGGLQAMLHLISHHDHLHKDTMHSAMAVITKLCAKMEPNDPNLSECSKNLGELLSHDDEKIAECALKCFSAMIDRFIRRQIDPVELARPSNLVSHLFDFLIPSNNMEIIEASEFELKKNSAFISAVLSLFANLSKGSTIIANEILGSQKLVYALKVVLSCKDERCINDCLRFIDLLLVLLCEGRSSISKYNAFTNDSSSSQIFDKVHRNLIDSIRQRDTDALIDAVENGTVDSNYVDDVGQTLLNWCSAFGTSDMVIYLCDKGSDPNKGQRSSSLHYAACFGRAEIVKILLRYGANPDLQDEEGRTALDKARERNDEAHQQVCEILQNPGAYMSAISNGIIRKVAQSHEVSSKVGEKEKFDQELAESFIQQLLPVFCTIFKNSLSTGVRRITLSLIRKCIFHISNEGLMEVIYQQNDYEKNTNLSGFIELLIGVLIIILESSENDVDSKEHALMIIKSLLLKNSKLWSEQLIRLGVYEKIEFIAKTYNNSAANSEIGLKTFDLRNLSRSNILSTLDDDKKDSGMDRLGLATTYDRSTTSTPSISLRSDSTVPSNDFSTVAESATVDITPSPTVEILRRQSSSIPVEDDNQTLEVGDNTGLDSPAFDNDLVEAATTIAQALGVQILQDATNKSDEESTVGSDDVWTIEPAVYYKWKDWRLIRAKDSLFIWCDAVAMELSDASNGWLRFLMNGRLSTLYSSGSPEYGADNADTRAEFIEKLQKAKATVPSGAQTKCILSIPRPAGRQIEMGNWQFSSFELNTLVITNREGIQQKLSIKDDLPGFIFESSRHHKQLFTAESTLGHDFVTGWAARGGGRRLHYFRVEVQRQKVFDLAKEIWETYLKKACDRPREAISEIQNCSKRLMELSKEISFIDGGNTITSAKILPTNIMEKNKEELTDILCKIRNSLSDDSLLSIFEISISGLIPSLLEFLKLVMENTTGTLAQQFSKIFADPKDFSYLVRKIIMVLESVEKWPQILYDSPGGSPFGFQLLTRRLRFRFEETNLVQKQKGKDDDRISITNRTLKAEPLVTVGRLKAYIHEYLTNSTAVTHAGPSTLSNLHYIRPPTAASLRTARKLPKLTDKTPVGASISSSASTEPKKHGNSDSIFSPRSANMAPGCLEKAGGSIKVKSSDRNSGKYASLSGSKQTGKKSLSKSSKSFSRAQRAGATVTTTQKDLLAPSEKSNNENGNGNNANACITQQQQKSMSTTNLFDADRSKSKESSSFNQAASAESLQHQTPSLENLLSMARLHNYSIPEESMATPNSGSPEPKNFLTFENIPTRFEKRKGSENSATLSIGASTFAGGSQPVLNSTSFTRERFQTVDSSTERLEKEQTESSVETINEEIHKKEQTIVDLLHFMDAENFGTQGAAGDENNIQENDYNIESTTKFLDKSQRRITSREGTSAAILSNKESLAKQYNFDNLQSEGSKVNEQINDTSSTQISLTGLPQGSNIGSNIRVKLGNYTDMLKHMMNQVLETGDSSDIYDGDDFENEIFEDELLSQYFIEADCEPQINETATAAAGISLPSDSSTLSAGAGFVEQSQATGVHSTTTSVTSSLINEAATAFESFAQVTGNSRTAALAAIRAAIQPNENILSALHPIERIFGTSTGGNNENRNRLHQMLLDEFGHSHINLQQQQPRNEGGVSDSTSGCARAIRINANQIQSGNWNNDFVLRQQFDALIPAFDPRPGRTNVNQTQEIEIMDSFEFSSYQRKNLVINEDNAKNFEQDKQDKGRQSNIRLYLKKAKKNDNSNEFDLIELRDDNTALFYYVQKLLLCQREKDESNINNTTSIFSFSDMNAQLWENSFTLVYDNTKNVIPMEDTSLKTNILDNCVKEEKSFQNSFLINQSLQLIRMLNLLNRLHSEKKGACLLPILPIDIFNSSKITQKLCQEMTDPLVIAARTMPVWCTDLVYNFPCLFSLATRIMFLNTTAFGISRAIGYLQSRRDQLLEQNRSATSSAGTNMAGLRREDHYPEYRIGRVKHERIKVYRNEDLFLESAIKVLKFHATRKFILEIEYFGEEGTGLGPTLEFFALISTEFQRKDLCMWHCDDLKHVSAESIQIDSTERAKSSRYYVHSRSGLFPAPWPANSDINKLLELFQVFGIFLAKAIQDDRLVDLPLSPIFIKLMLSPDFVSSSTPSIDSLLDIEDFMQIYPEKARFLKSLNEFIKQREVIENDATLNANQKSKQIEKLRVNMDGTECSLEDLAITFAVNPPSRVFPYKYAELVEDGMKIEVNAYNVDLYVQKCLDFYLNTGIREQMYALRAGFDMVFPMSSMVPFTTDEFQTILSGEQCPTWTREDLLRYTEPKLGYTRDSTGFLNFVEVLSNFDARERKAFLQFTTGCTSLPPGGLANLHPRLTIVRKVGSGDGSYPSVNTCVHYLKLPEYSSTDILRERLLAATFEKGFHLN